MNVRRIILVSVLAPLTFPCLASEPLAIDVGHPPPRYQFVIQDNPAARRFDLIIFSYDDRPICISYGGWPNEVGRVDWGSHDVKVKSQGKTFTARDWDFGYCMGDCMTRIPPHGTLKGFINYEEFGDPKQLAELPDKKLEYETLPHLCTPPARPEEKKDVSLSSAHPKTDHLVVVKKSELSGYRATLEAKLFVTPGDVARMIVFPPWQPEFAVSVYSTPPASADDVTQYHVTVTRASANVRSTGGPVQIVRSDADLPASAALPLKEVWKQMIGRTRAYEAVEDSADDQAIVQFGLAEPYGQILRGELPPNPSSDISTFEGLGDVLVSYGEAKLEQRGALAEEIEAASKLLLRKKVNAMTARLDGSLRIPKKERAALRQKAKRGDINAADRLSMYYGLYRNDKKTQLRYLRLGAKNNSDMAIRDLMTLYSTDSDLFNFRKALALREKLKQIAKSRDMILRSDVDWAYDRYIDNFKGAGNKWEGVLFLEYAAKQGSERARVELIDIYLHDVEVKNPSRARYWKNRS